MFEAMKEDQDCCPYCGDRVIMGAGFCRSCSRPLKEAKACPFCGEAILEAAIRCRYCNSWLTEKSLSHVKHKTGVQREKIDSLISASPIGAFLYTFSLTAIIYPPELHLTDEQVRLKRWTLFGLRIFDQKISTKKIASVRFHKGIIWSSITLETHGGAMADITVPALDIDEAQRMVEKIESVIYDREQLGEEEAAF